MKKVYILLIVLILSGCNNKKISKKKVVEKESKISIITNSLYSYRINYIDHDDYIISNKKEIKTIKFENNSDIVDSNNTVVMKIDSNNNLNEQENITDLESSNEKKVIDDSDSKEVVNISSEEEIKDSNNTKDFMEKSDTEVKEVIENNEVKVVEEKNAIEDSSIKKEIIGDSIVVKEEKEEIKKGYYSPSGKYLGETKVKVIDVSYYQKDINWDLFYNESDCYGVILRLGYWTTLDKKFERNISELKRLNIPYGIYLFSYSTTTSGALKEANFTNKMFDKYNLDPTLGIYYDIESWNTKNSNSNSITKNMYDNIITTYITNVSNHVNYRYKVKVYSGRWYAMNRLGAISKKYVDWVAEYNNTCKYDAYYSMWQYTSKGRIPGINGNVDISYLY